MARKKSLTPLGETEMEVLRHVWKLGEATVNDVRDRILEERDVAYTTIMTVMKNLAEKGYLEYDKDGVTYVYRPAEEPESVQYSLLKGIMQKVFGDSPSALVQSLVENEDLTAEERDRIRSMIQAMADDDE